MNEQTRQDEGTGSAAAHLASLSPVALSLCMVCFRCPLCALGYHLFNRSPDRSLRLEGTREDAESRPRCVQQQGEPRTNNGQ